jgi:iron complex outermembrane recepter protein
MKSVIKISLAAFTALSPFSVYAQAAPASEAGGVTDIVVTARRSQETLQTTPVAVSVVTSEKIAEQGLTSIDDFAKQATGISFSQAFGRFTDRPVIRGASNVLANVLFGVETGAAYFVDGVYFQGDLQSFDPNEIERVEIVKGPQSALYGRNTYAGAINYITKDPTNDYSGSGRARFAEHGEIDVAGSVSGPLIPDVLSFRAGGRYYKYNGEFRNNITGAIVGQEGSRSAYATFVLKAHPDMKMRTRISFQKDRDGTRAFFLQGAADNNCQPGFRSPAFRGTGAAPLGLASTNRNQWFCGTLAPRPNGIFLNTDPATYSLSRNGANVSVTAQDGTPFDGVYNRQINVSNVFDWDIAGSGFVFSILSGYRKNKNISGSDSDHSEAFSTFGAPGKPLFTISDQDGQIDTSHEVKFSTPEDKRFRASIGGYYYKQKLWTKDILFADGVARTGSVLQPLGGNNSNYSTILNRAVFAMIEADITDALSVTAEIRHANERKTVIERGTPSATGTYIFAAGVTDPSRLLQFGCTDALITRAPTAGCRVLPAGVFKGTDPRITINYTTPGGILLYANYATGRKPGGFNGTAGIVAQALLGRDASRYLPEVSKGFEIGAKFQAFDRKLRGAVAFYSNNLSNVQLSTAIPNLASGGALTSIVTTTANARTQGFEADLQLAPSKGLNLSAGLSYVNAKFRSGCDADLFIYQSGGLRPNFDTAAPPAAALPLCDLTGKRLPLASPLTANGSISYEHGLGSGSLLGFFNTNFSYESKKNIQTDNFAKVGSTFLLNGRLGVKTDRFTFAVFGRNLLNEDSVPLATRWFDLRYGAAGAAAPAGAIPAQTFNGSPAFAETGSPRGIFGALRKTRTFGVEGAFNF